MIEPIKLATEQGMKNALQALNKNLANLRTGRAHPSLLEQICILQDNKSIPLNHVASIKVEDARTLSVTPWEDGLIPAIEKAIMKSNLGLHPMTAGKSIRVPLPSLTEESRRDMIKLVNKETEEACVSIRNRRQEANNQLKVLMKEKSMTKDEGRRAQDMIQKMTDQAITDVKKIAQAKENELMQI